MTADPQPTPPAATRAASAHAKRWLPWAIFLAAIAVRLAYVLNLGPEPRFHDENTYWQVARRFLNGQGITFDTGLQVCRAPVYPLLLAASQRFFHDSLVPIRITQALLGALTCVLIYLLARGLSGYVCGAAAGAIAAVYPFFVFYTGTALSETLFTFELVLWVLLMRRLLHRPSWWAALLAGLTFGVAVLTRPSAMLMLPAALPLYFIGEPHRRRQARCWLLLAAAFAAVMAPWVWRNYRITGKFVPTTLQVGASLYESNAPDADGGPAMDRIKWPEGIKDMSEYERDRYLLRKAVEVIRSDWARFGRLTLHRAKRFWNLVPNYEGYRALHYRVLSAMFVGPIFVLGLIGLLVAPRRPRELLLLLLPVAYFAALHSVFVGSTRYRTPIMSLVIVFAGHALATNYHARARRGQLRVRGDVLAAWAGVAVLAAVALGYAWHLAVERGKLQQLVNESLRKYFGGPATIQEFTVNPWSGVQCKGVNLEFKVPGGLPASFHAQRAMLKHRWLPLVNRKVTIDMVRMEGVEITIRLRPKSRVHVPSVIAMLANLLRSAGSPTVSSEGSMRVVRDGRVVAELRQWKTSIFPKKRGGSVFHVQSSWNDPVLGRVQMQGELDVAGPRLHFAVTRSGIRLTPEFRKRLSPAAQQIWLAAGITSGTVDLAAYVDYDKEDDDDVRTRAVAVAKGVDFTYRHFAYPVTEAQGRIEWRRGSIKLAGCQGRARGATVRVRDAQLRIPPPPGAMLTLEARNLKVDHTLLTALPQHYHKVWNDFKPSGAADVDVDLKWREGDPKPHLEKIAARFKGCSMAYANFRLPIRAITGDIDFLEDRAQLRNLAGEFDGGKLSLKEATIYYDPEAEFVLPIKFTHIPLNERFRGILDRGLQAVWAQLNPKGRMSGLYRLHRKSGKKAAIEHTLLFRPDANAVNHKGFPLPLRQITGQIVCSAGMKGTLQLQALLGDTPVKVDGTFAQAKRRLRVRVDKLPLTEALFKAAGPGAYKWYLRVKPSGAVGLDAVVKSAGDESPLWADGTLTLQGIATDTQVKVTDCQGAITFRGILAEQSKRSLTGKLSIDRATIHNYPITDLTCSYSEVAGRIDIEGIQGALMGGRINGKLQIIEDSPNTYRRYKGELHVDGLRIENLFTPQEKERRKVKNLAGKVAASASFEGMESNGQKFRAKGALILSEGKLGELPLVLGILNLVKLATLDAAAFTRAELSYQVYGPVAIFNRADLIGPVLSLYGTGEFDAATHKLNFKFRPELGKDNKLPVATKIINAAKRMIFPVELKGTYDDPAWVMVPLLPIARAIGGLVGIIEETNGNKGR